MGELQWDRPELLEGRMRFVLRDGREILTVVETDPLAAAAGNTRFRQILPVTASAIGFGQCDIDVSFVTEAKTYRPHEVGVRLPQPGAWETVVLCCEPTSGAGLGHAGRLRESLSFDQFFADPKQFGIQSYLPTLAALEFPEQPLAYCAFDALLLPSAGFARLNGRQLDAIADWTRAGGAVCLAIEGTVEAKQLDFLNALFRDTAAGPFLADEEGRLIPPAQTQERILHSRVGMGYAAVLFGSLAEIDLNGREWREAQARLWRLRERLVRHRQDGQMLDAELLPSEDGIDLAAAQAIALRLRTNGYAQDPRIWTYPAPPFGTAIVEALRPSDIRLMPGWAVLLILFGYVALVGPIDYVLLGRLRLRKWTWLVFPATTLAVTWGVVATTDAFMSDNDHARSVEIIDLDRKAEPVRRTRLELLFRGSSERIVHESEGAFFSSLAKAHFNTNYVYDPTGRVRPAVVSNDAPTGPYLGSIPGRYVALQRVAKWTPQVNRSFEIAPDIEIPAIDWASLEQGARRSLSLADGRTVHCVRIVAGDATGPVGPLGELPSDAIVRYVVPGSQATREATHGDVSFLQAATVADEKQRFTVQFQRSPLGMDRLDDLPFTDGQDKRSVVLVAWLTDDAGNITVYRKFAEQNNDRQDAVHVSLSD